MEVVVVWLCYVPLDHRDKVVGDVAVAGIPSRNQNKSRNNAIPRPPSWSLTSAAPPARGCSTFRRRRPWGC